MSIIQNYILPKLKVKIKKNDEPLTKQTALAVTSNNNNNSTNSANSHRLLSHDKMNIHSLAAISSGNTLTVKRKYPHLITDTDPSQVWKLLNEIGDGAYGKVYKTRHRQNDAMAAAKVFSKCREDELDDCMLEVRILSECKHANIVNIFDSYYYANKLWVCTPKNFLLINSSKAHHVPSLSYITFRVSR
jgi:inhibitor of KinA sporulation pathway (predicted exonuclease)